ncbi:metalloregulator ArsR/SmtB family transcription factor [Adlercreutzia sp. ZJ473]|uniref:ArsR/SmtB family transcription factor n=1 Tax=Adlercreutzia sp. ZJ473 TaxID=2722822 RepID=UPI0015556E7F
MDLEKTALLFKALGDENRLRILELIAAKEDLCACRILDELEITQPTLSHHMKILKDAGLVNARKQGRWMHYSISDGAMQEGIESLQRFCMS